MNSIAENLERVRKQMAHAAANAGRAVDEIELVAITKTHPAKKVRAAVEAGQTLFGESRVQEARATLPFVRATYRARIRTYSPRLPHLPPAKRADAFLHLRRSGSSLPPMQANHTVKQFE